MTDNLTKLGGSADLSQARVESERAERQAEGKEIIDTKLNVAGEINLLGEDAEAPGIFSEQNKQVQDQNGGTQKKIGGVTPKVASVSAIPTVDVMIKETLEAIDVELKKTEEEIRILMRTRDASMYVLNDKVKKARFLYGLVLQLKRAAKLAEDYVLGLWKQFVRKST